ncbi:MAG: hypothetical protein QM278_04885 [Pseudomonadota bacterium]|nr:hypothetical protein [Pseudomonadota bacterium]
MIGRKTLAGAPGEGRDGLLRVADDFIPCGRPREGERKNHKNIEYLL